MAEILGTEVLENKTGTLSRCCFVNVRWPLTITRGAVSYETFVASEDERDVVSSQSKNEVK